RLIAHGDQAGGLAGYLQRLGDDGGDKLSVVDHGVGLKDRQIRRRGRKSRVLDRGEARGVLVREHGEDAGQCLRLARVNGEDPPLCDRALYWDDVGHMFDCVLVGIFRSAGHLRRTIDSVPRDTDGAGGAGRYLHLKGHACASSSAESVALSSSSSSVRTMTLRASGTLKALPGSGTASASSASAARRNDSSVAGAPRSAASAFQARHGLCATPPSARRTSRTRPSATSSAAATETRAKAYDARSR